MQEPNTLDSAPDSVLERERLKQDLMSAKPPERPNPLTSVSTTELNQPTENTGETGVNVGGVNVEYTSDIVDENNSHERITVKIPIE